MAIGKKHLLISNTFIQRSSQDIISIHSTFNTERAISNNRLQNIPIRRYYADLSMTYNSLKVILIQLPVLHVRCYSTLHIFCQNILLPKCSSKFLISSILIAMTEQPIQKTVILRPGPSIYTSYTRKLHIYFHSTMIPYRLSQKCDFSTQSHMDS